MMSRTVFPFALARPLALLLLAAALFALSVFSGCAGMEKHKYVFWGEIVGVKPDVLQDHWSDYGPFLPNDPKLKMRRGKAGVLRFYREKQMDHSVPVDGSLIVYVYHGDEEGVELTEPMAKLVLGPEKLEKLRKFDKKTGYTYHVWLDLGEIDLPEENISILAVFTDAKTKEQVASGVTYTRIGSNGNGSENGNDISPNESASPNNKKMPSPEAWARQYRKENGALFGDQVTGESSTGDPSTERNGETAPTAPGETVPADRAQSQTTIELTDQMSRPFGTSGTTSNTAGQSSDESRRFAAYVNAKKSDAATIAPGWNEASPDMNFNAPVLVAQKGAITPTPERKVGPAQKKLTFEQLRTVTGPTSEQGAYFTQGTIAPSGTVQAESPLAPKQNAAVVRYE